MKKYIITILTAFLILTSCVKEEDELMQSYTKSGNLEVFITKTSTIMSIADLENSYASFTVDSVVGIATEKLQVRVFFKGNNTSVIIEEIEAVPSKEFKYTAIEMANAVGYPVSDLKAKDVFAIEVLTTVNGLTTTSRAGSFNASIIFEDKIAGIYDVTAVSDSIPGVWDEYWPSVLISPNDAAENSYFIEGIAGSSAAISGVADFDAGTFTIASGQLIGDVYGWAPVAVVYGKGIISAPLIGIINADSSLSINNWGHVAPDYDNLLWDVFSTTWGRR